MPVRLGSWGEAMRNELPYVRDDSEALRWAVGCISTALAARLRTLHLLDLRAVRIIGIAIAVYSAVDVLLPTALTISYRAGTLGVAAGLGRATPGDDYQRLVPLMDAIPVWIHALSLACGAGFVVAATYVVRRRRAAAGALLIGVSLQLATHILSRPFVASAGVLAVPNPSFIAAVVLPYVFPALLAFAAWSGSARDGSPSV
jgi:hypothetical protein